MVAKKRGKVPVLSSDGSSDEPQPEPKRAARKSAASASHIKHLDDGEDRKRNGNRDSRQLSTVESHLRQERDKYKEYLSRYRKKATQKKNDVTLLLEQSRRKLQKAQSEFVGKLADVCANMAPSAGNDGTTARRGKEHHPLFQTQQEILKACHAVLECYDQAEEEVRVATSLATPREGWGQDEQDMKALLLYGKQYGESLAESIIVPAEEASALSPEVSGNGAKLDEAEEFAVGMFDKSRKGLQVGTWGQLAHAQVKALEAVVNTLPVVERTE